MMKEIAEKFNAMRVSKKAGKLKVREGQKAPAIKMEGPPGLTRVPSQPRRGFHLVAGWVLPSGERGRPDSPIFLPPNALGAENGYEQTK